MPLCSVITCQCSEEGHDGVEQGLTFHAFPKNKEVLSKWIEHTGQKEWMPTAKNFVCSRHFRDNDFFVKRSGKRYLRNGAIPCEHVVYKELYYLDDKVEVKFEANEAEASVDVPDDAEEPKAVVAPDEGPEVYMDVAEQPGPSRPFTPFSFPANQEPAIDSTIGTTFDMNDNTTGWEQFRTDHYFGSRLAASIFEDDSQDVGSSGFDDRYRRDVETSMNPYPPMDMRPHLERLPPPRTPEQVARRIRKIISKRKSSRKDKTRSSRRHGEGHLGKDAANEASLAEVREAESLKDQLQTGNMSDSEKVE